MSDWKSMHDAPRDGTVVEIKNSYGLLPTFGLFKWVQRYVGGEHDWVSASNENSGIMGGIEHKLSWRPHEGEVSAYRDYNPSMDDWRRAASPWAR